MEHASVQAQRETMVMNDAPLKPRSHCRRRRQVQQQQQQGSPQRNLRSLRPFKRPLLLNHPTSIIHTYTHTYTYYMLALILFAVIFSSEKNSSQNFYCQAQTSLGNVNVTDDLLPGPVPAPTPATVTPGSNNNTATPTPTPTTTNNTTEAPSATPSEFPSSSFQPSDAPSISQAPSLSSAPSLFPSVQPTATPSSYPSGTPTMFPTFISKNVSITREYELTFNLSGPPGLGLTNGSRQTNAFEDAMESYTAMFAPESVERNVITTCVWEGDRFKLPPVTGTPAPVSITLPPAAPSPTDATTTATDTDTTETESNTTLDNNSISPAQRFLRATNRKMKTWWWKGTRSSASEQTNKKHTQTYTQRQTHTQHRHLQTATTTSGEYIYFFRMKYESNNLNVTEEQYTRLFEAYIQTNNTIVAQNLTNILGLAPENNLRLLRLQQVVRESEAPSISMAPSTDPTMAPTRSSQPSAIPSAMPSQLPSMMPTVPVTLEPTIRPTVAPTLPPKSDNSETVIIIVSVVVAIFASIIMVGLLLFYRARQLRLGIQAQASTSKQHKRNASQDSTLGGAGQVIRTSSGGTAGGPYGTGGGDYGYNFAANAAGDGSNQQQMMMGAVGYPQQQQQQQQQQQGYYQPRHSHGSSSQPGNTMATSPISTLGGGTPNTANRFMSPNTSASILSNPSLLSNGQDDDDDDINDDDDDDDNNDDDDAMMMMGSPLDDFDRYKDQTLEQLRSQVNGNVEGIEGMMSQAMTFALMGGGYDMEAMFGEAQTGTEIETNILCEVTAWMKRNYAGAGVDDR